jgi:hypothetical protein
MALDGGVTGQREGDVSLTRVERLLIEVEAPPWNAAWRCMLGFGLLASYPTWFAGGILPVLGLLAWFLGALVMLRVIPGVLRRTLPLSESVQTRWRQKRGLGRTYDCYQWRKLLWIGLGMVAYCLYSASAQAAPMSVALGAMVGGGIGMARWQQIVRTKGAPGS